MPKKIKKPFAVNGWGGLIGCASFLTLYKNKDTPGLSGKIEIISEKAYCDNCIDVVDQFQKDLKNIEVI